MGDERRVKWTLRGLTLLGIGLAAVSMGKLPAVLLTITQLGIEQFLERIVFQYTTVFIQPIPTFDFDMRDLTGMSYVSITPEPRPDVLDMVMFSFSNYDLAHKFFDLLREWNYGEDEDRDDNIQISFVWAKDMPGYYICLSPNPKRKSVEEGFARMRAEMNEKSPGKEQQGLVLMWGMKKLIGDTPGEGLRAFAARQTPERPHMLGALLLVEGQKPVPITDITPIRKFHLRIVNESELTEDDREFHFMNRLPDQDDND